MNTAAEKVKAEQTKTDVARTTSAPINASIEKTVATAKNEAAVKTAPKSVFREYFESFVVTLIMAFFGMTFLVQAVTVPTGSMQNTIMIGDHLLVNKFIFAPGAKLPFLPMRDIRRGDIAVFKYPGNQFDPRADYRRNPPVIPLQTNYIKRVIGLPGDTIEFRNNQVFVNGELLPEHRAIGEAPTEGAALDVLGEVAPKKDNESYTVYYHPETVERVEKGLSVTEGRGFNYAVPGKQTKVPPDYYLMMGDARDDSEDSRVWGFVHRDLIVGRAMFVYWSCDQSNGTGFVECLTNPRLNRIGKLIK